MVKTKWYKNRRFLIIFVVSVLLLAFVAVYFYNKIGNVTISAKTNYFYIKTGDSYEMVLKNLVQQEIISDVEVFDFLAFRANYNQKVKPGRYKLNKGETYLQFIRKLRAGEQEEVKLVINAMITPRKLAGLVGSELEADSITLIGMFEDSIYLKAIGFTPDNVLCLILPNTYNFYWNTTAEGFMNRMKKEYAKFWNDKRKTQAAAQGLTPIEVGILASIVDGETNKTDEMSIVAGLYLNRLKKGILLQADPTVKFALRNSAKKRVYAADTKVPSPYNTYMYAGLPPGPIALPSQQAITSVLSPSAHNYIFMCAKEDLSGYHNFTDNLTQHNLNARRYQLALDKLGIK